MIHQIKPSWRAQLGQRWKPEKNHRTEATEVTEDVQKIGNHWFCCRALGSLSPGLGGGMNTKSSSSQNETTKAILLLSASKLPEQREQNSRHHCFRHTLSLS